MHGGDQGIVPGIRDGKLCVQYGRGYHRDECQGPAAGQPSYGSLRRPVREAERFDGQDGFGFGQVSGGSQELNREGTAETRSLLFYIFRIQVTEKHVKLISGKFPG